MQEIKELSDIQSEAGIIGTLVNHPEYVLHSDALKPSYFFGKENGCVYWAIQELYKDGITNIDPYNISNKLQSNSGVAKTLEKYNLPSVQEFMALYQSVGRESLEEYKMLTENVITLAFKRDLAKTLEKLQRSCYRKDLSLTALSGDVYGGLDGIVGQYVMANDVHIFGEDIDSIWDDIVSRRSANGTYGIPSKYRSFADFFTYEQGELVVLQAKYKRGKSVFLMNEVVHKLQNGVPTLVIDSEMPTRLYAERLLTHITKIPMKRIKSGQYSEEEAVKIQKAIEWLKGQPFVHIYDPQMSNEKLYTICKMLKYKIGLTFVVYDYVKSNETSTSDNYNILGAKCDFLKNRIAGELDLAVLSACQLNRAGEVADSDKINRYLSVGIKWGYKTQEMTANDGIECGNAYAKIYVNRLGPQMQEDDEEDYIDFYFDGDTMTIVEAKPHERSNNF